MKTESVEEFIKRGGKIKKLKRGECTMLDKKPNRSPSTPEERKKYKLEFNVLKLALLLMLLSSCATMGNYPSSVCSEYGRIRRESKSYVFCNVECMVYLKKDKHYINRCGPYDFPEVKEINLEESMK